MKKYDMIGNLKEYQDFIQLNLKKAKKFAQKSISQSYLTGCTWIMLNENENDKNVFYTFRNNDQLLITTNGNVEKAKYEIIIDNNSLLIEKKDIIEHFNIVNFQDDYLILNKLSTEEYLVFANQTKYKDAIKENVLRLLIKENEPVEDEKYAQEKITENDNTKNSELNEDYIDIKNKLFIIFISILAILIILAVYFKEKTNKNSDNIEEAVEAPPVEEINESTETFIIENSIEKK